MVGVVLGHLPFVRVYLEDELRFLSSIKQHTEQIHEVTNFVSGHPKVKISKCELARVKIFS